ncbi:MAG: hypothetical protein ABEH65_07695 [Halobacteriales archaeon]
MPVRRISRRELAQTTVTGLLVGWAGCIDQAQDLLIGGHERKIFNRYKETYRIATRSVDLAADGLDDVQAGDWTAAKPKFQESRGLAQRSIDRFRETYDMARFIANTKVQRSVTESWTKCLSVRDFTTEAMTAVNYMENGSPDSATQWFENEALPNWEAAQDHELVPPAEIKRELGL